MPFVEGESLRDRLTREKQLPIQDAWRIATEIGNALDYAHRHGVIHRSTWRRRADAASRLSWRRRLFTPECKTPEQMRYADAFCRFLEMAEFPTHLTNGSSRPGPANLRA